MKDFLGKEIEVGDNVVFMCIGYRDFRRGVIEKITPKKVKIVFAKEGEFVYGAKGNSVYQFHSQVIKVDE